MPCLRNFRARCRVAREAWPCCPAGGGTGWVGAFQDARSAGKRTDWNGNPGRCPGVRKAAGARVPMQGLGPFPWQGLAQALRQGLRADSPSLATPAAPRSAPRERGCRRRARKIHGNPGGPDACPEAMDQPWPCRAGRVSCGRMPIAPPARPRRLPDFLSQSGNSFSRALTLPRPSRVSRAGIFLACGMASTLLKIETAWRVPWAGRGKPPEGAALRPVLGLAYRYIFSYTTMVMLHCSSLPPVSL